MYPFLNFGLLRRWGLEPCAQFVPKRFGVAITLAFVLLSPEAAMADAPWYQVEVIVFRYTNAVVAGDERYPKLASTPDFGDALPLVDQETQSHDDASRTRPNEVQIPGPRAFESLPRSELTTSGVFQRLRGLQAYDPVLHVGWRQPARGARRTYSVLLSDNPRGSAFRGRDEATALDMSVDEGRRVEGTLRVQSGRQISVAVDFFNDDGVSSGRLTERRAIRFKELHYFDDPAFGIIVQVTPYRAGNVAEEPDSTETSH
ncbi:MAG: hypothetical protein ACI915_003807 [Gammaproteobacteria bacterium]|jgi:hypothetical protein